jgi:hypothetical protein
MMTRFWSPRVLEESLSGRQTMSISKLRRYMTGTVSIYTKSTCAQTMCMDHVCPYLSMNKIIEQRGMTKACEKEDREQREMREGMGKRTKGNLLWRARPHT